MLKGVKKGTKKQKNRRMREGREREKNEGSEKNMEMKGGNMQLRM